VAIEQQRFAQMRASPLEVECQVGEIEGRVHLVNRGVVIGAYQD